MTTFLDATHSTRHIGAERVGAVLENAKQVSRNLSGTRGLATLLLSAIAAAVMVVAYQVMDSVTEGHLLVMWMALWISAFAALALFGGPASTLAANAKSGLDAWSYNVARSRADHRLMVAAERDPRVMADLRAAIDRSNQAELQKVVAPASAAAVEPHIARLNVRARRLARLYY